MEVYISDDNLDRLETDPTYTAGFSQDIVKSFRKKMQFLRAANDKRDLYNMRSLNFERLEGKRKHQHSIRLNAQFRLIMEISGKADKKKITVIGIEDYH